MDGRGGNRTSAHGFEVRCRSYRLLPFIPGNAAVPGVLGSDSVTGGNRWETLPVARWWQRPLRWRHLPCPGNDVEVLTLARRLAMTAPTDEKADLVLEQAEILAARMSEDEVNQAKAAAEEHIGPSSVWGDTIAGAFSQFVRDQEVE